MRSAKIRRKLVRSTSGAGTPFRKKLFVVAHIIGMRITELQ
jgi:hypothetical protein